MNKGGFSWKRALGVSAAKSKLSRQIGIPLTKSGRQRKIGKMVTGGGCLIPIVIGLGITISVLTSAYSQTKKMNSAQEIAALKAEVARLQSEAAICRNSKVVTAEEDQKKNKLEAIYRGQYEASVKDIEKLKGWLNQFNNALRSNDDVDLELSNVYEKERNMEISRADVARARIKLLEEKKQALYDGLVAYNAAKNENRTNISMFEIKAEAEITRSKINNLTKKNEELQIKIIELRGDLPSWWIK